MHTRVFNILKALMLTALLVVPATGWSNAIDETPTAMEMTGDALFARPVLLVMTVVGTAVFIVSSPFSALGGNFEESFDVLVKEPFNTTFVRCLGCTTSGRKAADVVEQEDN